jgi:RHS repeat-associated protein
MLSVPAVAQSNMKTETITYHDDRALWIVGQTATVVCTASVPASTACDGDVATRTEYGWKALPWKTYSFGKLQQTLAYDQASTLASGQLGTLKTVTDGRGNVTTLSQWKRGVPGRITYPATTDQPTAVSQSASINDDGTIAAITDENGFVTRYGYDTMGRLSSIDYPDGDTVNWTSTTRTFSLVSAVYGIPTHWRMWERTGNGYKLTHYDGMWRPLVEDTYDNGNVAATRSIVVKRYDAAGRLAFQSYPLASLTDYADATLKGTRYTYDALDRVYTVTQDSELGPLTTTSQYLVGSTGSYKRIRNPRGYYTRIAYQAFDQPSEDFPVSINNLDGYAYTEIARDPFGKPTSIKRRNTDGSVAVTRTYAYNVYQELCRVSEPETNGTLLGYDGAGNLAWTAGGVSAAANCDLEGDSSGILARKVSRTYDARNRLKTLTFADHKGDKAWTYTPDGLPATIAVTNPNVAAPTTTSYTYNRRRLLTRETLQPLGGTTAWSVGYAYNTNGHRTLVEYPTGLDVSLAPNGLGQPTAAGTFATNATYAPNGAIASFTYGNNILHQLTQNARGLPDRSLDIYGSTHYLDDGYDYDQNGNVLAISDGRDATQRRNVSMQYDGLDRLTQATSKMFGNTGALATIGYTYDVLDNLTRVNAPATANMGVRNHYYCYNGQWQLAFIRTGPTCTGSTPSPSVLALEYDLQGNVIVKDAETLVFDMGNRLRSGVGQWYAYDGWGRRVLSCTSSDCGYSFYSMEGPLLFSWDERSGKKTEHIYLGGSLVAERSAPLAGGTVDVRYQHTDALGSPVFVTDQARTVIAAETAEYDPYGRLANRAPTNGPGYTGHVEDAATGLVYMQQRYYDPQVGRFLSVDPATSLDNGDMRHFNRYAYSYNNPYKFFDPDGRAGCTGTRIKSVCDKGGVAAMQTSARSNGVARAMTRGERVVNAAKGYIDNQAALGPGGQKAAHFFADDFIDAAGAWVDGKVKEGVKSAAFGLLFRKLSVLRGATVDDVVAAIPDGWQRSVSNNGKGIRFHNPERQGEAVRIQFGDPNHHTPVKQGNYFRISEDGRKSDPIPLEGNPTL